MDNKEKFGPTVRKRRKKIHMSIERLAELCEMSDKGISNIERGVSVPKLDTALQICSVCGIDVGELSNIDYRKEGSANAVSHRQAKV